MPISSDDSDYLDIQLSPKRISVSDEIEIEMKPQGSNNSQGRVSLTQDAKSFCEKCGTTTAYGKKICDHCGEEPKIYPGHSSSFPNHNLLASQQSYFQPNLQQQVSNYPIYQNPQEYQTPQEYQPTQQYQTPTYEEAIHCPRCGSQQITYERSGYGWGKGMIGAVLLGPIGLLGGMIGSKKIRITCIRCGNYWNA